MNQTVETILNHRSIRKFTEQSLSQKQISVLIQSAQAASTSSFVQAYSIIGVSNQNKKEKLAQLAGGQEYVEKNGHFFVFCADLYRHQLMGEWEQKDITESLESAEKFMVATIDAALAAQNMSIAAESLGLGICYIGGIRNNLKEVDKLLEIPDRVIPLFGLSVGYPAHQPNQKLRLTQTSIYHEDVYEKDKKVMKEQIEAYDKQISAYYEERTRGERKDKWSEQMVAMFSFPKRLYLKQYLEGKGLNKK
ncbi:oxygen-insensitive NADPH nitroreductase [Bacillus sp. 2205SS5-2]|uniref:oxygen-insensitive NADPH nitroreductase n=1 Tax=Bacillus sp. 2205SS5-2 TaxID=3109031 RepID=UPI0030054403